MLIRTNPIRNQKGITLIELLIVVPLVAIIIMISYNLFFLSTKSFNYVKDTFNSSEDIRVFINNIQKEASQAKKAVEDNTVLFKPANSNNNVLYIYTDIDNDDIPELVRYRLEGNEMKRDIKKAANSKYPFKFTNPFTSEKVVLSNITNDGIFGEISYINTSQQSFGDRDNRRKVKVNIEIYTGKNSTPIIIDMYLVTKSRTEFE
ncbi:prepilin-type N-terminal cleavage/methylation domain-containing protein [Proteiniborus sp. MB09-C3]|uniref:PilW family protein n=1 Tax=Proteiniborus sp. MB09-C3 TaxID=3050072 RepID=UPI002556235E|nr:prepilin-type N-terminal cleavage/methylation domain-containing protein [Proteiniborus sp. MB09-C3]WIV11017.1 prepilin-type N-terminal cleavage/methylation domain-containing protein [Proteiniborus sp. MB09-C3]